MALPMLESLRSDNPEVKINWMCGRTVAPLLEKTDLVDELIVVDESRLLAGNFITRLVSLMRIWFRLLGLRFDLVVTGHADPKYRLLSLTVWAGRRERFRRDKKRFWPIPGRHHSDEYVRLVSDCNDNDLKTVPLPTVNWDLPSRLQQELPVKNTRVPIALAPGGAKNVLHEDPNRRWPLENYVALADKLINNDFVVILTGAPDDDWVQPAFAGLRTVNLIGKTSLTELVALYQKCQIVVTHDSGPLHLAGLAGIPQVALFGPTNPYEKVPRHEKTVILWSRAKMACCPCYDGRYYADCQDNRCLKSITVERVYDAVSEILK